MSSSAPSAREGIFAHWPNRITLVRFIGSLVLFGILHFHGMWQDEEALASRELEAFTAGVRGEIGGYLAVSFWLFIVIACTDFLDGWLARRGNSVTAFGRIADPFVDKVLVLGAMVFLAVMEWSRPWFPAWIVVVVLAREFLVTGIRGYIESLGMQFPADWFGKIKMIVQCVAIAAVLGLFAFNWPAWAREALNVIGHVFVWGTLVTTVGSGASYVLKTRRMLEGRSD